VQRNRCNSALVVFPLARALRQPLAGLSEPGGSRDQKEPCPDGDNPDGLRESFTGRRETFDGDRCRHGSHRAKIHDPDDQEDCQ